KYAAAFFVRCDAIHRGRRGQRVDWNDAQNRSLGVGAEVRGSVRSGSAFGIYSMTMTKQILVAGGATALLCGWLMLAADVVPNSQPNPYKQAEKWYQLPEGRTMGSSSAVDIDSKGHIWVAERCGANSCAGKDDVDPILEFDPSGKLLKSFGKGMFIFPHGICIDKDDNIWITDEQNRDGKGAVAIKFNRDGRVLLTIGKPGVASDTDETLNQPNDV